MIYLIAYIILFVVFWVIFATRQLERDMYMTPGDAAASTTMAAILWPITLTGFLVAGIVKLIARRRRERYQEYD